MTEFLTPNQNQYGKVKIREPRIFSSDIFLANACLLLEKYISEYSSEQINWRQRELLVIQLIEKLFCFPIKTPEVIGELSNKGRPHFSNLSVTRTQFELNLQTAITAGFNSF